MRSKMSAFKRPVLLVGLPSSANFLLPCWCMRRQRTLQHFGADIEFHFRRTSYIQSDCGSETWLCLMDLMWRTGHCAISRSCWSSKANAWQIILGFPFPRHLQLMLNSSLCSLRVSSTTTLPSCRNLLSHRLPCLTPTNNTYIKL